MTLLVVDHSQDLAPNVRAFITEYLEEPGRKMPFGVHKAGPVKLRVEIGTAEGVETAHLRARHLGDAIAAQILIDTRVRVACFEATGVALGAGEKYSETVELLPWLG
ncbi:MAG: hypothetical protein PGN13_15965 [Patulibacter minatonensis]